MAENDGNDRGPVSRGGIAPQPLFAVGAVLLGSFLANFDSRLTSVGLPDLRGAFSLGFDEGAWLSTAGIGSQILHDLGVREIKIITNNPRKIVGLEGYGLKMIGRVPLIIDRDEHNADYLQTKRDKLGHLFDTDGISASRPSPIPRSPHRIRAAGKEKSQTPPVRQPARSAESKGDRPREAAIAQGRRAAAKT